MFCKELDTSNRFQFYAGKDKHIDLNLIYLSKALKPASFFQ
ncbi:hypothetical protein I600_2785 [Maribacter dokdonensis DSW-8]|nr:hypothetical protein I600_2785 [Maribacter dokdonensis DSW-8]